jgi:D-glycero-D-manno-heptose 1,7-bisphosphate phosphatase
MHEKIALKLNIKEIIYCPHTDSDQCDFRKPNPGMINKLIEKYKLNKKNCLMIGDTKKDQDAAKNAKISSVLIKTKYNQDLSNVNFIDSLSNFKQ